MNVSLSIVIPVLDEAHALPRILAAVEQCQQGFETEVIVVDGGSTDGTLEVAHRYQCRVLSAHSLVIPFRFLSRPRARHARPSECSS